VRIVINDDANKIANSKKFPQSLTGPYNTKYYTGARPVRIVIFYDADKIKPLPVKLQPNSAFALN